ncbi:MAG: hypothetical protein ACRED1_03340, partial [Limisphaerales bacterium]
MKTKSESRHLEFYGRRIALFYFCLLISAFCLRASGQSTAFTYQGRVTDNGTNFNGAGQFQFALVTSTNTSSAATATITMGGSSPHEFVNSITLANSGNGYTVAPNVTFSGGGGSGAQATTTISGGAVSSITLVNPGSGYSSTPTVTIDPPPANITYTTYWSNDGTSVAGSEPSAAVNVTVSGGLFTVVLGDTNVANMMAMDASLFSQPNLQLRIWFNDGVNGFAALDPAQALTPAPYAVNALTANNLPGLTVQQNVLGAPNVIGGASVNFVSNDAFGATIGGGGATNYFGSPYTNSVMGDFGTVSGGAGNSAGSISTVGGGADNAASGQAATVAGGGFNTATNAATVGGGEFNAASGVNATIGGGQYNTNNGSGGFIGAGTYNTVGIGYRSTVGGGSGNTASNNYATVSGGINNVASEDQSTVSGGAANHASGEAATVSGGYDNQATDDYATV